MENVIIAGLTTKIMKISSHENDLLYSIESPANPQCIFNLPGEKILTTTTSIVPTTTVMDQETTYTGEEIALLKFPGPGPEYI